MRPLTKSTTRQTVEVFPNEVSNRISEDKVLNSRGKNLLDVIGSIDLTILNGSVLGDIAGKYTCHLYNGSSTVNYILTSQNLRSKVKSMIVGELTRFSDHCNLSMKLDIALPIFSILSASKYSKAPKRYPWNKDSSHIRFTSELNSTDTKDVLVGIYKTNCQNTRDVNMNRKIIEVYQNAAEKSIAGKKHKNNIPQIAKSKPKESWFDDDLCYLRRRINRYNRWLSKHPSNTILRTKLFALRKGYKKR